MKLAGYCFPACGVDSSLKITLLITDEEGLTAQALFIDKKPCSLKQVPFLFTLSRS